MTETASVQSAPGEGSLVVGRIRPPMAMWAALEGVINTSPVRNGVLIIFSQDIKGRIGIFCNRYISGAIVEPSGEMGLEAVRELLSIKGGMFGFRACMGDESAELAQSLGLDIEELLQSKSAEAGAGDALRNMMIPGSSLLRTSDFSEEAEQIAEEGAADKTEGPADEPAGDGEGGDFSYLDWFAEQMGSKDQLPKFRQILAPALPPQVDPNKKSVEVVHQAENDLELYGRLLEAEKLKVIRDIERSMARAGVANGAEEVSDLKLLSEFIQSEQNRAQKWQGLDEIPTPHGAGGGRAPSMRPRSSSQKTTGEFGKECNDLVTSVRQTTPIPKDFIKRTAEETLPVKRLFAPDWLRRPYVIGGTCIAILGVMIIVISGMQTSNEYNDCVRQAKTALDARRFDDALFLLNKAVEKDPVNQKAYFYRGIAYATSGDYDNAKKDFDAAIMRGAPRERVLLAEASGACRASKFEEALKSADEVLKGNPKNVEALMIKATCLERNKDYLSVDEVTTRGLSSTEDNDIRAHLLVQRGFARAKTGKHSLASADFGEAIKLNASPAAFMQRGDAYRLLKKYSEAAADYGKVINGDPRNYDAYVARGMCYNELHQEKAAMKDFGRALAINKSGVEALIQRGSLHLKNANYRLAANDLEDAMALAPHDVETQQKLASAYTQLHRTFPKSWLHAASSTHLASSSSSSMISDATSNSSPLKMPSSMKDLLAVGYKYLTQGELQYAQDMFAEAIRREPNNPDARRYMAHTLVESGSSSAAASQFNALSSLQTLTSRDALSYAKALSNSGARDTALDVLTKYVGTYPADFHLRAELIKQYNLIGFAAKAQTCYRDGLNYARTSAQRAILDAAYHASGSPTQSGGNDTNDDATDAGG